MNKTYRSNFIIVFCLLILLITASVFCQSATELTANGYFSGVDILASNPEWKYTSPLPFPRYSYATFEKNGFLYVVGGCTTGMVGTKQVIRTEMKPDGTLGDWVVLPDFPITVGREAATVAGDYAYVSGGSADYYSGPITSVYRAKIEKDGSLGTWTLETASHIVARFDHSLVYLKGYIYAIGGGITDSVEFAKVNTDGTLSAWKETHQLNRTRWLNSSLALGNHLYCASNNITEYANMGEYGEVTSWSDSGGTMPTCLGHPFFSSINTTLYVYGGWEYGEHIGRNMMKTYINPDGSMKPWTICSTQLNDIRSGIPTAAYNNTLYAIAGDENVDGYSIVSTVEYMNFNYKLLTIDFSSTDDINRFAYELPPDNKCTTLGTYSWVSSFDGCDGIMKIDFTKPNQGTKMTLRIPEWFSSDSGKWYQLSINYRASSKSSTNTFQSILHLYEGVLPEPTTITGNGLLSCPTTWFTLKTYLHSNGCNTEMFPQVLFKNYGNETVSIYIDSIQTWEVLEPLMIQNNFAGGSFDQSTDVSFWQYELPDVAYDTAVYGIQSSKFFVDFSGATTEGLKMTMASGPGQVISYAGDMDRYSGQDLNYTYTGSKASADSMILLCMFGYSSTFDDPNEINAIARINSLNQSDAGYLETIYMPRESNVYTQLILKNKEAGTLWIDEAYPLKDYNKVD
jgi:hypothetical protein